jgi:glycosyltransferase involved in cell wall biosynthesis
LLAGAKAALAARQHRCDHLHAHFALPAAATAIVAAKLAGLTASFMAHGYDVYGTPADLALKLAAADFAIASCEDMRDDFLRLAPTAKVRLVSCGVDPTRFRPVAGLARNGRLLAVGRLVEQKGYDVLLSALASLPAAERPKIDAVGGGELADSLSRDAAALGVADSIRFLGARSGGWIAAEGPAYLGFVAPYCITANGDRDTGPLVVREAMAMGLPVVASALMGMKETVTAQCGRHVPPRDVAALAAALKWLAALPENERLKMGAAGRRRVEAHYTIAGQAAGLAAAIRAVQP